MSNIISRLSMAVLLTLFLCADLFAVEYDVVIRGGRILDGSGNPWFYADIAIDDGRFVKVGSVEGRGEREIDAAGRYVSPGWIDMMDQSGSVLLKNGNAANKILMGVTSAIGGEGGTPAPAGEITEYFETLEKQGISINFGSYYNAFQARQAVIGMTDKVATEEEISKMRALMAQAMTEGVVGMSTAAFYPPASFMTTHEFVEIAKAMTPYRGIYAAHMRDESRKLVEAIEEMITVAEAADIPVEIFHFKNAFAPNWDKEVHKAIALIEEARARGVEIAADQYPYIAGGTGLDATVPTWVFADGFEAVAEKVRDPEVRERMKIDVNDPDSDRVVAASGGWENVVLVNPYNEKYDKYNGKNLEEIGVLMERDPADAAWDIMLDAMPNRAYALYFMMDEKDVQTIMRQPWVSIGSDAGAAAVLGEVDDIGLPHPRAYGTFPRIIAKYVREEGVLTLEDAVRKMTSWPASRMKMKDRGMIKPGQWADVVIFDYATIQDNATWDEPMRTPSGIDVVMVNGVIVAEDGQHTGARPGQVLYGPGKK
jgi:N-acyl-D-amino-acid deacylase